jgi:hypothetical protein
MKKSAVFSLGVLALMSAAAPAQQMDMAAMQKWASAELIRYHIVGVYQDAIPVSSDSAGLADIGDRVIIDFTWKMSQQAMTGEPAIQNFKSTTANLRDPTPACLAPVLHGEYEHYELLSVKAGMAGTLQFTASTSYPVVDAAYRCTMSRKPVPAKVVTKSTDFSLPAVVLFGMPIASTDELTISPDKKFFTVKKDGWTWTIVPTLAPTKVAK